MVHHESANVPFQAAAAGGVPVLDQRAVSGQAGASVRIEYYLGLPAGISGQALAGAPSTMR